MIHSGRWLGWWEQAVWGRQPMTDLTLHLADGHVTGTGRDVVGSFTFTGTYDAAGHVLMVKRYQGRHEVLYEGQADGEGGIHGRWSIGTLWTGPFALMAERRAVPPDAPIQEF